MEYRFWYWLYITSHSWLMKYRMQVAPIHGMWVAKQMSGRRCVEFFVIRRAKITKIKAYCIKAFWNLNRSVWHLWPLNAADTKLMVKARERRIVVRVMCASIVRFPNNVLISSGDHCLDTCLVRQQSIGPSLVIVRLQTG